MRTDTITRNRRSMPLLKGVLQRNHMRSIMEGHESYDESKAKATFFLFNGIDNLRRTYLGQHNVNSIYVSLCKIYHIFKRQQLTNAETLRDFLNEQTSTRSNEIINRKLPLAWTEYFITLINQRQSLNKEIKDHKQSGRSLVVSPGMCRSTVDYGK